jgi:hypothetical protein
VVVSGDAMFDQRDLSLKIVQVKGDYLWTVKDNQEGLRYEKTLTCSSSRIACLS